MVANDLSDRVASPSIACGKFLAIISGSLKPNMLVKRENVRSVCLGSVGRTTCETAPARHLLPLPVGRPTSKRIAIKECSPAELLDDPVFGLVTMSNGVNRQTLEILARELGRRVLSGLENLGREEDLE